MRSLTAVVCVSSLATLAAQTPSPQLARDQTVLRISVDLVQVDATVTDARGRHVRDLTAADFELLQDGKRQRISTFAFIDGARSSVPAPPLSTGRAPQPAEVRRTIALVVDDLGLSFESTARLRGVLRQFVDKQLQPGDLVAILRTGAGMGALQQFTTDRAMLHAAVDRVRWNVLSRMPAFQTSTEFAAIEEFRNSLLTTGTLGAVRYVIRGVSELPGRKSVVLLSEGFRLRPASDRTPFHSGSRDATRSEPPPTIDAWQWSRGARDDGSVLGELRDLVELANRAGVVVYTIDARGLVTANPAAEHGPQGFEPIDPVGLRSKMADELRATQDALGFLAHQTGGLFLHNTNDLSGAIQRAVDDQRSYYLLGYVPDASTFERASKFRALRVRVLRPGLRVRSRSGFLGVPDRAGPQRTPANRMIAAVTSPFAGGDVRLRLSSFFARLEQVGPALNSVMHVDSRDLTFAEDPDGTRSVEIETLAVTFGDNGRIIDQSGRRHTVRLAADAHARALDRGFIYRIHVPLKRPGPHQLRLALRDVASDRIGSATQFVDVPDLKNGRLALSSLVIEGRQQDADPAASVALRTFRQGAEATYACYVYNARLGEDGRPQLQIEARVLLDGTERFRATLPPVWPTPDSDPAVAGVLPIGSELPPGSYLLHVEVVDRLAGNRGRATQTIDFDVTR